MSVTNTYAMDPDGDLLIILAVRDEDIFAPWEQSPSSSENGSVRSTTPPREDLPPSLESIIQGDSPFVPPVEANSAGPAVDAVSKITYLVSSKVLSLASPVIKRIFKGSWKEATTVYSNELRHLNLTEFDQEALRIVLAALHFRYTDIPEAVTPELLAKIAVIADYFQCESALAVVGEKLFQTMQTQLSFPQRYNRDLVLCIFISSKFPGKKPICNLLEYRAISTCSEPFQTCGLPIGPHIVDRIDRKRIEIIGKMIGVIYDLIDRLLNTSGICSSGCGSFLLGTLLRSLNDSGMHMQRPEEPYDGISVATITAIVDSAVDPYMGVGHDGQIDRIVCHPQFMDESWLDTNVFSCNAQILLRDMETIRFQLNELLQT